MAALPRPSALERNSLAVDKGNAGGTLTVDQRGFLRHTTAAVSIWRCAWRGRQRRRRPRERAGHYPVDHRRRSRSAKRRAR